MRPNDGESEKDFMERCMSQEDMVAEYDEKQRAAVCSSKYRETRGKEASLATSALTEYFGTVAPKETKPS